MNHFFKAGILACIGLMSSSVSAQSGQDQELIWYMPGHEDTARLFVKEVGTGEPVVVLHGGPGSVYESLYDIRDGLTDQFRFVFYNQRGSERSRTAEDNISINHHIEDLELLRINLGVEKLNIISHSAGTMLAMQYLNRYPENTGRIVMLGATDPYNGQENHTEETLAFYEGAAEERDAFYNRPALAEEVTEEGLNNPTNAKEEYIKSWILGFAGYNIYHIDRWRQAPIFYVNSTAANATQNSIDWNFDWRPNIREHDFPITVINGDHDVVVGPMGSPIWVHFAQDAPDNFKLNVLPNAGHSVWIDQPEMFREALLEGLTR